MKDDIRQREKGKVEVLARSPAGNIEPVENLKRRQQAVYWRPHTNPDGETIWVQTRPLPADVLSRETYFAKGFRLTHPDEKTSEENEMENLRAKVAQLQQELGESRKKRGRKGKISE